jgi:hypothetical protein
MAVLVRRDRRGFQLLYTVNIIAAHGELANGGALGLLEPLFSLVWFLSASIVLLLVRHPQPSRGADAARA